MPATRGQIRRPKHVQHTVDFGEDVSVTFTFDANKITDAWMDEWTRHEEESNVPQINAMLADLIETWDILEDENGPAVPVSADEVGALFSLPDKLMLMREFCGLPQDSEGNASRNISSTQSSDSTSTPASHPNGQQTSATPEPVASPSLTHPT
jgi:hypothetical protein